MDGGNYQETSSETTTKERYAHLLTHEVNVPVSILVSAAAMLALAFIANITNAPNPNMILISGLVICAAFFGYAGGITSAIVMMAYTLAFFSTNHDLVTFSDQNLQKVIVSAAGILVVTFFVSTLKLTVTQTVRQLKEANAALAENNQILEEASSFDSLTGTHNRFALRRDFPSYLDKNLHVMMIDIDDFKNLNDTYGHSTGDYVLNQMGRFLTELCSPDNVYRYGGDEFLIVCPCEDHASFEQRAKMLKERVDNIDIDGPTGEKVHFSAGYVYGTPSIQSDLRLMIRQADVNLYSSKDDGKNQITGCAFSRAKAAHAEMHQTTANGRFETTARQLQPRGTWPVAGPRSTERGPLD